MIVAPHPLLFAAPGLGLVAVGTGYAWLRPDRQLVEITVYVGLWLSLSAALVPLSYFGAALALPLRDDWLRASDAWLGFDWLAGLRFLARHPWFDWLQGQIYSSHLWQPTVTVVALALWGPRERNFELFCASVVGAALCISIGTLLPALGPAAAHGITTPASDLVVQLRDGTATALPYAGIIWFPSYHTVMAILFAWAHRGLWSLPPFLALNLLMLLTIPFAGEHYLTDLLGGAGVGVAAIWLTARFLCGASVRRECREIKSAIETHL